MERAASASQTDKQPRHAVDRERSLAEQHAVAMAAELHLDPPDVMGLSDDALCSTLQRLRRQLSDHRREAAIPAAARPVLARLFAKAPKATAWMRDEGIAAADLTPADHAEFLENTHQITVNDRGIVHAERILGPVRRIIADERILLFHHTATGLEDAIRRDGLIIGKQTNFFNSQAGVYISTMPGGMPVDVYSKRAALVHGGEPMSIGVIRRLPDITPDPDDADLDWAQGRQFITRQVPPEDLVWP